MRSGRDRSLGGSTRADPWDGSERGHGTDRRGFGEGRRRRGKLFRPLVLVDFSIGQNDCNEGQHPHDQDANERGGFLVRVGRGCEDGDKQGEKDRVDKDGGEDGDFEGLDGFLLGVPQVGRAGTDERDEGRKKDQVGVSVARGSAGSTAGRKTHDATMAAAMSQRMEMAPRTTLVSK